MSQRLSESSTSNKVHCVYDRLTGTRKVLTHIATGGEAGDAEVAPLLGLVPGYVQVADGAEAVNRTCETAWQQRGIVVGSARRAFTRPSSFDFAWFR